MHFPDLSEESIHLSLVLNASSISLPLAKLRPSSNKSCSVIQDILNPNKATTRLFAGSVAEGLAIVAGEQYDPLASSDTDMIAIDNIYKVYEDMEEVKRAEILYPTLKHVLRHPDKTCPGYSKLTVSEKSMVPTEKVRNEAMCYLKNDMKEKMRNLYMQTSCESFDVHGPAVSTNVSAARSLSMLRKMGGTLSYKPADVYGNTYANYCTNTDYVHCLRGRNWPDEASEWVVRQRFANWPTQDLIDRIIASGYILAGVGSKESNMSDFQWRVSFNTAELSLIQSFNETQFHCIWLLKSLKSRLSQVAGKNITSYTMKTLMFWCMEEKSNEYWQPSNLIFCFCFCISKLKSFVVNGFLPNYFIRERNQFVSSEFTSSVQTKTLFCLDNFLKNPKDSINSLIPNWKMSDYFGLPYVLLEKKSQMYFLLVWIVVRKSMAFHYRVQSMHAFWKQYDGHNIENSFLRCKDVSEKLSTIEYAQPFVKSLQNCMAVLKYVLLKREKEILGHTPDSDIEKQWLKYTKLSFKGDKTHTRLRTATCYLDKNVKEKGKILNMIRKVTDQKCLDFLLQNYTDLVEKKNIDIYETLENMPYEHKTREIEIYHRVINQDLINKDPYRTLKLFKQYWKQDLLVGGYRFYQLLWRECWFDVTFMPAELPILPKPAALELCIDRNQMRVSFNPIFYGLLLEFLCHVQNNSNNVDRANVIEKMMKYIILVPDAQQSTGLNFITYCCSLQQDYCSASRYLIQSFGLNPVKTNVAYLYIKYIINLLRTL